MEGTVIRITGQKGFGFIRGTDGKDYFFHKDDFNGHFSDLVMDWEMGRKVKVTFESVPSDKGLRAGQVYRPDGGV